MESVAKPEPPKVRWDLSALFSGLDDPRIDTVWQQLADRCDRFEATYRGKIDNRDLTAAALAEALGEAESISNELSKPIGFAHLMFATDAGDPSVGAFLQKQREKATELSVRIMFFELELQAMPQELVNDLLQDECLANYRHFIHSARAFSKYRLSEPEEIILEEMANTGSRAWVRLFEELTANHVFKLKLPGSEEAVDATEEEVLAHMRNPDRAARQAAGESLTTGLAELERVLVYNYNNMLQDKAVEDRLRKHDYPEQARHISNELDKETVNLVVNMCRKNYDLVERFYRVKRDILGLPELTHIDRYAPLFDSDEQIGWDRAKQIVLEAFGSFSPTIESKAREFFDSNWIDAEPRKGKQGGAFCSYNTPDTHPVVLQSYLNRMNDVTTLAHELGHGVHASLSRAQTLFNFQGTLPLAELASIFGEMLVFERLVGEASPKDKLALYAEKIEGLFASVFRQSAMFCFERRCHLARRNEGEQTAEQIGQIWLEENQAVFGSSVKIGEQYRTWWSYISHFVAMPFYVYAYSFGELLVQSLYQMAKAEGPSFADKYVDLLTLGGSKTPDELMATVGVDLRSEQFWQGGFRAMESFVAEFERLWAEYKTVSTTV